MFFAGMLSVAALAQEISTQTITGDVIRVPVGQQSGTSALPRTGESRSAVLQLLGQPERQRPPVGEPPISAWEYSDLVVYFEHDHVIRAVRKHTPRVGAP